MLGADSGVINIFVIEMADFMALGSRSHPKLAKLVSIVLKSRSGRWDTTHRTDEGGPTYEETVFRNGNDDSGRASRRRNCRAR